MVGNVLLRALLKEMQTQEEQRVERGEKKQASKLIFQSCLLFQEGVTCSNDLIPLVVM